MAARSRTVLLAVDVAPTHTAEQAMRIVEMALLASPHLNPRSPETIVESWHFAEDNRPPGSDEGDSAVFCAPGRQEQARAVIVAAGLH